MHSRLRLDVWAGEVTIAENMLPFGEKKNMSRQGSDRLGSNWSSDQTDLT
jgi:hypothetical protein